MERYLALDSCCAGGYTHVVVAVLLLGSVLAALTQLGWELSCSSIVFYGLLGIACLEALKSFLCFFCLKLLVNLAGESDSFF